MSGWRSVILIGKKCWFFVSQVYKKFWDGFRESFGFSGDFILKWFEVFLKDESIFCGGFVNAFQQ